MKKVILTSLALALVSSMAYAAMGDVVASFAAPYSSVRGLARSNTYLYMLGYSSPNRVWRMRPTNGSVYGSFATPVSTGNRGLTYSWGGNLWIGRYTNNYVYRVNEANGSVRGSWSAGTSDAYGLGVIATGDGGQGPLYIMSSDSSPSNFFRHALSNGSISATFPIPNSSYYDCAYDWRNGLMWMGDYPSAVYGYRASGTVAASFTSPGTYPYGMAYHGQYLWIACDGPNYIYQVHCPATVNIQPASVGSIKALFK